MTYFARTMASFVERLGLVSLWSDHPVNYTYMHNDNKSVSVLDYPLLSPRLLGLVEECGVVERGDNLHYLGEAEARSTPCQAEIF